MAQQNQYYSTSTSNSNPLLDSLYCSDEHLDYHEEVTMSTTSSFSNITTAVLRPIPSPPPPPVLLDQDMAWDDHELVSLLSKENPNPLVSALANDASFTQARGDAVVWILKVVFHYSFSPLTASLAVDYLDRFLSGFGFRKENPWTTQLAAVACLSLAAKVEETQVPILLDFQVVEESKFLFEAKTIKRMELLVLSTLNWKMNPVTPISFLDFIIRRLGFRDHLCFELLKRCESTIVSLIPDSRFMCFLPSTIATATMLHVVDTIEPCLQAQYHDQLLAILGIDKEKVENCREMITESESENSIRKRKYFWSSSSSVPTSPSGVNDVSFSSDSSNDSWSVSSSPETTLSKKLRPGTTTSQDFLGAFQH